MITNKGETIDAARHLNSSIAAKNDKSHNNSFNNAALNSKRVEDTQKGVARNPAKTSATPLLQNRDIPALDTKNFNKRQIHSKNNSVVSHSDRTHLKIASPANKLAMEDPYEAANRIERDRFFSNDEEQPESKLSRSHLNEDVRSKSDWNVNNAKPGVDISEFYNPSAVDDADRPSDPAPNLKVAVARETEEDIQMKDQQLSHPKDPKSAAVQLSNVNSVKSPQKPLINRKSSEERRKLQKDREYRNRVKDARIENTTVIVPRFEPQALYNPKLVVQNKVNTVSGEDDNQSSGGFENNDM